MSIVTVMPEKRYLSRTEAATWIGVSIDFFDSLSIPYVDYGPRIKRWDIVDIIAHAEDNKRCDSARTPNINRRRQLCVSTKERIHQAGGLTGTTKMESDFEEVLELPIES